jgi:hypothetical protein
MTSASRFWSSCLLSGPAMKRMFCEAAGSSAVRRLACVVSRRTAQRDELVAGAFRSQLQRWAVRHHIAERLVERKRIERCRGLQRGKCHGLAVISQSRLDQPRNLHRICHRLRSQSFNAIAFGDATYRAPVHLRLNDSAGGCLDVAPRSPYNSLIRRCTSGIEQSPCMAVSRPVNSATFPKYGYAARAAPHAKQVASCWGLASANRPMPRSMKSTKLGPGLQDQAHSASCVS